jgi:hypothetical protein
MFFLPSSCLPVISAISARVWAGGVCRGGRMRPPAPAQSPLTTALSPDTACLSVTPPR